MEAVEAIASWEVAKGLRWSSCKLTFTVPAFVCVHNAVPETEEA